MHLHLQMLKECIKGNCLGWTQAVVDSIQAAILLDPNWTQTPIASSSCIQEF
jgi:hypothetical protein